jgi:hypothetical protein
MFTKMPDSVSICGVDFKVVKHRNLKGSSGEWLYGKVDFPTMTIRIAETDGTDKIKPTMQRQTLWHEVLHAVLEMSGDRKMSEDEAFVTRVSNLLHQALG